MQEIVRVLDKDESAFYEKLNQILCIRFNLDHKSLYRL